MSADDYTICGSCIHRRDGDCAPAASGSCINYCCTNEDYFRLKKDYDDLVKERVVLYQKEAQERSGFNFGEFLAAGEAAAGITAVPPDCGSHVKPAANTHMDFMDHQLRRLEARLDLLVRQVAELSGQVRYLTERTGGVNDIR